MPILAIDFGTTTTVAAVRAEGAPPRLVAIDGSPLMPSSVFLTDNGTLTVGRDADRQARLDPSRYEPNPKRRIDDGEVLLGQSALPVVELIAAVLRRVAGEVTRQFGSIPADVRLTHPARWGRVRRRLLVDAAAAAGLGANPTLVPEPVAAATHYANLGSGTLAPDAGIAVYDLGGGTFDVAVLRRSGPSWTVVAEAGLSDLGGVDFDQAIVEHLGSRQAGEHQADWDALLAAADAANRRLRRAFETDVRDCKEALSRYAQSEVPMSEPFHDELLTRTEFEQLIRPQLDRTIDLLTQQLQASEVPASALAGIYLVGGSSRIPLVARLMQERLGITPTTLDQPETSVATGALLIPVGAAATSAAPPWTGGVPAAPPVSGSAPGLLPPQYRPQQGPPPGPVPQQGPIPRQPPIPQQGRPGQSGYGPPSGRVPAQHGPTQYGPASGPVRQQPGGPPGYGPPPTRSRVRWLVPAAGLVVVAVVVAVVLATRGKTKQSAQDPPTSPSSSATRPSPTGPSGAASTNSAKSNASTEFDSYFSDPNVRAFMRPSYKIISSCNKPDSGLTLCKLTNGLTMGVGNNVSAGRQESLPGATGSLVTTPHTSWKQTQWSKGQANGHLRTWEAADKPDKPYLYWDRNGSVYGILAIRHGDVVTTDAAALRATWKQNFER